MKPLWYHLTKCFRGLVADGTATHVPFLAIDPDRHKGIPTDQFLTFVKTIADIFEKECSDFRISAEVNPQNGSSKLFAWPLDATAIEIEKAEQLAERIHRRVEEETGQSIEVFPHNMKNVRLPLHPEKHTIVDSGLLGKVVRRKGRAKQKFETYSAAQFAEWVVGGSSFDREVFFNKVVEGCKNLPDEPVVEDVEKQSVETTSVVKTTKVVSEESVVSVPQPSRSAQRSAGSGRRPDHLWIASHSCLEKLRDEPNSLIRQHRGLLIACQKAKRVLEVEEALDFIYQQKLFTGDWEDNEGRRADRVRGSLDYIAKTFDPAKCSSGDAFHIDVNKYEKWAEREFGAPVRRVKQGGGVRQSGEIYKYKRYVGFTPEEAGIALAIAEFCLETSQYGDGGVPEERMKTIWTLLHLDGQIDRPWCVKRWRLIRDLFVQRGVLKCDFESRHQKAYCYEKGRFYPGRKVTWRKWSKTGLPGCHRDPQQRRKNKEQTILNSEGVVETRFVTLSGQGIAFRGPP